MKSELDTMQIPAHFIPCFKTEIAVDRGVERNLLFRTWGGLGDQICAEPTLRYALSQFRDCKLSLASEHPELFQHLKFDSVFDTTKVLPLYKNYLTFETIVPPDDTNLVWQFVNHMLVNCVDFPTLCALRSTLPVAAKEIILTPGPPAYERATELVGLGLKVNNSVFVHPGRHWPTKTFPKDWWDDVLAGLVACSITPVLIGANTDDNRGTVDVNAAGCLDLRNKLTVSESVWFLQRAGVLLTNDSAPLHMAASYNPDDETTGHTWTGYVATCKHPDLISHWRQGEWNYREVNLGVGGLWETVNHCPNTTQQITADQTDEVTLRSWLPEPSDVVSWTCERL